ncbi:glycosyltransferase family 4 protein [Microbacterium sp. BDGP8]|uniref:glycosyltransferase family 4 protein n=1 Tax=Microbacterium sp. BDGP8 TaxID=3035531 RepID=UPI00249F2B91|nr:glycosyltransferase family 4 protein [Microbacterium sp. BDGP8]WHE35755.1 glycosyltransferase family 4 protein [Microbacterium sp. BDGP8]
MSLSEDAQRRLRVVWLCLEWPGPNHRGGVARYAYRLAAELAPIVDLTIITESDGEPLPGARMRYLPASSSRIDRYYVQPLRARRMVKALRNADVVHAFGDDWALGRGPWKRVRHFLGLSLSEARSSKGLRRLNHYVLAALEKYSQFRADFRIAIGPESRDAFRCDVIMPPVVPIQTPATKKTGEPTVVFVGSYSGRKRGRLAEEAVRRVSAEIGTEIRLIVFGPADDARNWSAATDHRSGASDAEVQQAISASWALLSPSEYEGFGIPIFEGLALGTAVIASPNPGSLYQAQMVGQGGSLHIAQTPEQLFDDLRARMIRGAELTADQKIANRTAVDRLVTQASVNTLVDVAYG